MLSSDFMNMPFSWGKKMREIPVMISGAGPVGLTFSIMMSRFGIETLLVEKRADISTLPRARGVMSRTVEIWSQFGLYDELHSVSLPEDWCHRFIYFDTLSGELIGEMPSNCMAPGAQAENTAYDFKCTAQDKIDSMLFRNASGYGEAQIRFSTELIGYAQKENHVVVTVRNTDGSLEEIRTQWLIAADGGRSPLREMAGITSTGPTSLQHYVNNHFTADLSRWTKGKEGALIWLMAANKLGVFQPLDGKQRWMCQIGFDPEKESAESWTPERVIRRMRDMIGGPEAESINFDLHSTYTYTIAASVADRLRDGRLLLIGDAAHRIPPAGGIGMNTGIQTAHNLAWKLAAVLKGYAPETLLDTFDGERREVAKRACDYGRVNVGHVSKIHQAQTRDAQVEAVRGSKQYGNWAGLDLGVHYEQDGAFVPDDVPAPAVGHPVIDYVPCAKPGYRAPHIWLRRGDERFSAIDLFDRDFVLLTGAKGDAWRDAAQKLQQRPPLRTYAIADTGNADLIPEGSFTALYGIGEDGAVLVRPDGHVAWRSQSAAPDPSTILQHALDRTLCRAGA
jgi:putative polyketide hydroxylase